MEKSERIKVMKTYKLYIGGKFPRTESGRYYVVEGTEGPLANACQASRKDFRNAVVAARGAFASWSGRTAYNRGQILYRIAEVLEGRSAQFVAELQSIGLSAESATEEVNASIDRIIYYAGWCDKFQQVFSAVNPVASSHFNFTVQEATGVVTAVLPEKPALLALVSHLMPILSAGNASILLSPGSAGLVAITFAEVLNASDVPGGVVNLLSGDPSELLPHMAAHMDVNALVLTDASAQQVTEVREAAVENVKRVFVHSNLDYTNAESQHPYMILETTEAKTTWHPIEQSAGAGAGY